MEFPTRQVVTQKIEKIVPNPAIIELLAKLLELPVENLVGVYLGQAFIPVESDSNIVFSYEEVDGNLGEHQSHVQTVSNFYNTKMDDKERLGGFGMKKKEEGEKPLRSLVRKPLPDVTTEHTE